MLDESSMDTILGVAVDVDAQGDRLNQALSQIPHDQIPSIIDHLPVMIAYVDTKLNYQYVNRYYRVMNSCTNEDVLNHSVQSFLGPKKFKLIKGYIDSAVIGEPVHYVDDSSYARLKHYPVDVRYQPCFDESGNVTGYFEFVRFVNTNEAKDLDGNIDLLTGLKRRQACVQELDKIIYEKTNSFPIDIYQINITRFRDVNTSIGMNRGDQVLQKLSVRLSEYVGKRGTVYRTSGDAFTIIYRNEKKAKVRALKFADKLQKLFKEPLKVSKYKVKLSCKIAVVKNVSRYASGSEVLRSAEFAKNYAIENDLANCVYHKDMRQEIFDNIKLKNKLQAGMKSGHVLPWFQPFIDINAQKVVGYEALARWVEPDGHIIPPSEFIAFAEKTGQIRELGSRILIQSLQAMAEHVNSHPNTSVSYISVNVSPVQISSSLYIDSLTKIIKSFQIPSHMLQIEVTEEVAATDNRHLLQKLEEIKSLGVRLACDDFGVGYSSLSRLRDMPWDYIKIDRSFIANQDNRYMISPIIDMAKGASMSVIAEGVETREDHELLKSLGCHFAQGYYYGKPSPSMSDSLMYK